jgi:hypothetical protein
MVYTVLDGALAAMGGLLLGIANSLYFACFGE